MKTRGDRPFRLSHPELGDLGIDSFQMMRISKPPDALKVYDVNERAFEQKGETPHTCVVAARAGSMLCLKGGSTNDVAAAKALLFDPDGRTYSFITVVDPNYWDSGFGTQLAEQSMLIAKERSGEFFARVDPKNGPQLNSYINKMGMTAVRLLKDYYLGFETESPLRGGELQGPDMLVVYKKIGSKPSTLADEPQLSVGDHDRREMSRLFGNGYEAFRLDRAGKRNNLVFRMRHTELPEDFLKNIDDRIGLGPGLSAVKEPMDYRAALKLEAETLNPPSTVFFLKAMDLVGGLFAVKSGDEMRGFSGVLLDKEGGLYMHGPFVADDDEQTFKTLMSQVERSRQGTGSIWTIVPDNAKNLLTRLDDRGFEVTDRVGKLFRGSDGLIMERKTHP